MKFVLSYMLLHLILFMDFPLQETKEFEDVCMQASTKDKSTCGTVEAQQSFYFAPSPPSSFQCCTQVMALTKPVVTLNKG